LITTHLPTSLSSSSPLSWSKYKNN
jgi:hypothetical protein